MRYYSYMREETNDFIRKNSDFITEELMEAYTSGTFEFENLSFDSYSESLLEFLDDKANREDLDFDLYEYLHCGVESALLNFNSVGELLKSLEIQVAFEVVQKEVQEVFEKIGRIDIDSIKSDLEDEWKRDNTDYTEDELNENIEWEIRNQILCLLTD